MNGKDQAPAAKTKKAAKRAKSRTKKSVQPAHAGRIWAGLAFIASLIALGTSGYVGYIYYTKQNLLKADVLGTLRRLESDTQQIEKKRSVVEKNLDDFQKKFEDLKDIQDTLATAVDEVTSDLGRNRSDWALAETEQLLLVANYRLQLARDPETAVAALRAADRQLQQLGDPRLLPVRRLVAAEITQLQSLERADVPGIALKLGSLAKTVDQLPLDFERRFAAPMTAPVSKEAQTTGWGVLRQMWHDLLGLVRIRKDTESQQPLLAPEQQYFLRENLRLMLYGTQLAVLQGDVATYTQSIDSAQNWIHAYFKTDAKAVVHMREELQALLNEKIAIELPDISESLEALRAVASKKADS